ncbi:hypothetical protein ACFVW1_52485 [Streptomyces olivochromogenes]|uniref:hypothetical protein n=1 Tax=Streptomyces olivochromogenes TaxID=1963 RepID=UPI0036DCA319
MAFVVLGNSSAGGAVARPLLNGFYAALTPVLPHGAALSVVRGIQYFDGTGIADGVICLSLWAVIGTALLAAAAFRRTTTDRTATVGLWRNFCGVSSLPPRRACGAPARCGIREPGTARSIRFHQVPCSRF